MWADLPNLPKQLHLHLQRSERPQQRYALEHQTEYLCKVQRSDQANHSKTIVALLSSSFRQIQLLFINYSISIILMTQT